MELHSRIIASRIRNPEYKSRGNAPMHIEADRNCFVAMRDEGCHFAQKQRQIVSSLFISWKPKKEYQSLVYKLISIFCPEICEHLFAWQFMVKRYLDDNLVNNLFVFNHWIGQGGICCQWANSRIRCSAQAFRGNSSNRTQVYPNTIGVIGNCNANDDSGFRLLTSKCVSIQSFRERI